MDLLNSLQCLIFVLDEGSFSAAARRLGKTQPAVSQLIAALERQSGASLIHRGARGVTPTRAGEIVYDHAHALLKQNRAMIADLEALGSDLEGALRISVSFALGKAVVSPVVLDLRESHPDLCITVRNEDRLVDVVREGYDLALRLGNLGEGEGHARRIATLGMVLAATPGYLDKIGRPETHDELGSLDYIQYRDEVRQQSIPLLKDGDAVNAPVQATFFADNPEFVMSALESGVGFVRMPLFFVHDQLKNGRLEPVLPDYDVPGKPVYVIRPTSGPLSPRHRLLIDRIQKKLATFPGAVLAHNSGPVPLAPA